MIAVLAGVVGKLWTDGKTKDDKIVGILTEWREDVRQMNSKAEALLDKTVIVADTLRQEIEHRGRR